MTQERENPGMGRGPEGRVGGAGRGAGRGAPTPEELEKINAKRAERGLPALGQDEEPTPEDLEALEDGEGS